MKKKKFEKLKESLLKKGYKIFDQQWRHEDYIIGKSFHKEDNKWEECRPAYQILLSIYDWTDTTKEFYNRIPPEMKERVGIEIHIDVSRTIDEGIDMSMSWLTNTTIEEVEAQAEEFYKWVNFVWFEPREETIKEN